MFKVRFFIHYTNFSGQYNFLNIKKITNLVSLESYGESSFFRKKRGIASEHDKSIILRLSLNSLKLLKRYIDTFKKQFDIFLFSILMNSGNCERI